jgi:thiamine-phosphate pyrophosphorylase
MSHLEAPRVVFVTDLGVVSEDVLVARILAVRNFEPALRARLAVQLREPEMEGGAKARFGARLRAATSAVGAQLFVNDRLDLAVSLGADGVHLGRRSVSVNDARELVGKRFVSRACHDLDDVRRAAAEGADGGLLSPIFSSPGKGAPLGVDALTDARAALDAGGHRRFRLFALGGVDAENAVTCLDAGADGVAVVRADLGVVLANLLADPSHLRRR